MPTQWEWKFDGGLPETSTDQYPVVAYNRQGEYTVTLTVSNAESSDTQEVNGLIKVQAEERGVLLELNKRVYAVDETTIATY
jgi:PKD repeat protein